MNQQTTLISIDTQSGNIKRYIRNILTNKPMLTHEGDIDFTSYMWIDCNKQGTIEGFRVNPPFSTAV